MAAALKFMPKFMVFRACSRRYAYHYLVRVPLLRHHYICFWYFTSQQLLHMYCRYAYHYAYHCWCFSYQNACTSTCTCTLVCPSALAPPARTLWLRRSAVILAPAVVCVGISHVCLLERELELMTLDSQRTLLGPFHDAVKLFWYKYI